MPIMRRPLLGSLILAAGLLAACSSNENPRLIAVYPQDHDPCGDRVPAREDPMLVESVFLDLSVADPAQVKRQAESLAYSLGGYVEGARLPERDGGTIITLELMVPGEKADFLRNGLVSLGRVIREESYRDPEVECRAAYTRFYLRLVPEGRPAHAWYEFSPVYRAWLEVAGVVSAVAGSLLWIQAVLFVSMAAALMLLGLATAFRRIF